MEPSATSSEECPRARILTQLDAHVIGRASFRDPKRKADVHNLLFVQPHLSKNHAELRWTRDRLYVVDTDLSLGTMLNNKMLVHGKFLEVVEGDVLGFGIYKSLDIMEDLVANAIDRGEVSVRLDNVRTTFQIKIEQIVPRGKIIKISAPGMPAELSSSLLKCLSTQTGDDLVLLCESTRTVTESRSGANGSAYEPCERGVSEASAFDVTGSRTSSYTPNLKYNKFVSELSQNRPNKHYYFDLDDSNRHSDSLAKVLNCLETTDEGAEKHTSSSSDKPSDFLETFSNELSFTLPNIGSKSSASGCDLDIVTPELPEDSIEICIVSDDAADDDDDNDADYFIGVANSASANSSARTESDSLMDEDVDENELFQGQLHLIYDEDLSDDSIEADSGAETGRVCSVCHDNENYLPDWSSLDEPTTLESDDELENDSENDYNYDSENESLSRSYILNVEEKTPSKSLLTATKHVSAPTNTRKRKASELDYEQTTEVQPPKKVARLKVARFALIAFKGFELCLFGFLALAAYGSYLENRFEYVDQIPPYNS